jgi:hypothetical protein
MLGKVLDNISYLLQEDIMKSFLNGHPEINSAYRIVSVLENLDSEGNMQAKEGETAGQSPNEEGIWISAEPLKRFALLDVKDSLTNNFGRSFHEKILFTLTVSHTVIVKLWPNDIGELSFNDCLMLQKIFELEYQLVTENKQSENNKRKFLIILGKNPQFDGTMAHLHNTIEKLWNQMTKPIKYATLTYDQFFDISFKVLDNNTLQRNQFALDCPRLYEELTNQPGSGTNSPFYIPFDSLHLYWSCIWKSIKSNEPLNLVSIQALVVEQQMRSQINEILGLTKGDADQKLGQIDAEFRQHSSAFVQRQIDYVENYAQQTTYKMLCELPYELNSSTPDFVRLRNLHIEVDVQLKKVPGDIVNYNVMQNVNKTQGYIVEQFTLCIQNRYVQSIPNSINAIIDGILNECKKPFWEGFNEAFVGVCWQAISANHIDLLSQFGVPKSYIDGHFVVLKRQTDEIVKRAVLDREPRIAEYLKKLFDFNFWIKNGKERHFQKYTGDKVEKIVKEAAGINQNCINSLYQVRVAYSPVVPESVLAESVELINQEKIQAYLTQLGSQAEANHSAGMKKSKEFSLWNVFKIKYVFSSK